MADLHSALRADILGRATSPEKSIEFALVKLTRARDRFSLVVHAYPSSYSFSGVQTADILGFLGFTMNRCTVFEGGKCYAREVSDHFELDTFARGFGPACQAVQDAEKDLNNCGLTLEPSEGNAFFGGGGGRHGLRRLASYADNGHVADTVEEKRTAADERYAYNFTWITGQERGWVTHVWPIVGDLSPEERAVFDWAGLRGFKECPQHGFEPCWWFSTPYQTRGGIFESNAESAYGRFEAMPVAFLRAVSGVIDSHDVFEGVGLPLLSLPVPPVPKAGPSLAASGQPPRPPSGPVPRVDAEAHATQEKLYKYDVAISFAGEQLGLAQAINDALEARGVRVFFAPGPTPETWGANLPELFDRVFRKDARYCLVVVSAAYKAKMWPRLELRAALARAVDSFEEQYLLPIRTDDTNLPGLRPSVGYVDARNTSPEDIVGLLVAKLGPTVAGE